MKCPTCSTPHSNVLDTRGDRRRRRCFNGHTFFTEETVVPSNRDLKTAAMAERNKRIRLLANAGWKNAAIGKQFSLSAERVREIVTGA